MPPERERRLPKEPPSESTAKSTTSMVDAATPSPAYGAQPLHVMTKADRDNLARLARMRGKQSKAEAGLREKVLLADIEDLMTAEFSARDEMWAEAVALADKAAQEANAVIVARCAELGIPAKHAPGVAVGFRSRSSSFSDPSRRAELRKRAQAQLDALTTTAKTMIDAQTLKIETELIVGGLDSSQARAFMEAMPTVEQLMPAVSLDDLGVVGWQPPKDAAAQLLTPSTPADRRRKVIRQAIEADPGASNRAIAEITGFDHKTVAAHRRTAGELPASGGEIPSPDGELPTGGDGR